jgi:hypothetical protein
MCFTVLEEVDHVLVVPFRIIHFVHQFFFVIQYFHFQNVHDPIEKTMIINSIFCFHTQLDTLYVVVIHFLRL